MPATSTTSVTINAEPSTVWKFMSDQTRFLSWMTFMPGMPAPSGSTFEPKPGGDLLIIFPNGGKAKGSVLEVDPPRKLVFTWGYDPDVAKTGLRPGASRVEIVIRGVEDGTLVTLNHIGPMSEELAKGHEAGWRHYLSQLALQSAMEGHQSHLADTLSAYFKASTEADATKRDALLATCCMPNIRVRTQFACCDSLAEFSANIANGLRHMPGATLEQNGLVSHLHGYARVPWKVMSAERKLIFKGENFVRFTPGGQMAELVSFPG
jgi:uncharacterized protein YndB with AHSA1/START domain